MNFDIWEESKKRISYNLHVFVILMLVFLIIYFVINELFGAFGIISTIIGSALDGFMLGWYVATLYNANSYFVTGKEINYVDSIKDGFSDFLLETNPLIAVVGLVVIGGILDALAGGGVLGVFLYGIPVAVAVATALTSLAPESRGTLNYEIISEINDASSNAGLFIYLTILIAVIPVIGLLQLVMLPMASVIISIKQSGIGKQSAIQSPHSSSKKQ